MKTNRTPVLRTAIAAIPLLGIGMALTGEALAEMHCHDVVVYRYRTVKDHDRIAGTAIGAVAGGLIGHSLGGGSGKTALTIGGAAAGAYAGNQIQKHEQRKRIRTIERVCTKD
jgi:uncharacterized protein YcfJ